MPILLGKNQKGNLNNPDEPQKWYAYAKTITTVTEKQLAEKIAARTAINQKEAEMVLFLLKEAVIENILNGNSVMLGDWAYFYPTVTCEPSDTKEEVDHKKIKKVKLHLRLGKEAEKELQEATYVFIENLVGEGRK